VSISEARIDGHLVRVTDEGPLAAPEREAEPFDFAATMDGVTLCASFLADMLEDLERASATISQAHTLGPILDPTAYRRGMKNLDDSAALLGPMLTASRQARRVIAELKTKAAARA